MVIPLFNEEESLNELHDWIVSVMKKNNFTYEIILIDDGSKDTSWKVIEALQVRNEHVRGYKFRRNYGKSAGLNVGFEQTKDHTCNGASSVRITCIRLAESDEK